MIIHRRGLQESDLRKEAPHARVRWELSWLCLKGEVLMPKNRKAAPEMATAWNVG
jgi:hypothetical protein